jgi:phage shock protein C
VIQDDALVCAYFGRTVAATMARRRLVRPRVGRKLAGVCLGLAEYFALDVTLIRVVWILAVVFTIPLAIVGYLAAWIIVPEEPRAAIVPVNSTQVTNSGHGAA